MSQCLVVPRKELEKLSSWQNLQKGQKEIHEIISLSPSEVASFLKVVQEEGEFRERFDFGGVEADPSFQQIIFYGLLVRGDEFFVYKRGDAGMKEKRLVSKLSVGVGGHIEPFDSNLIDSLYRELDEELAFIRYGYPINFRNKDNSLNMELFKRVLSVEIKGLIKNDSDDVGRVHTGLFCVVNLLIRPIEVKIKDKDENVSGSFVFMDEYQEITKNGGEPEVWTQLVMKSDLFPFK